MVVLRDMDVGVDMAGRPNHRRRELGPTLWALRLVRGNEPTRLSRLNKPDGVADSIECGLFERKKKRRGENGEDQTTWANTAPKAAGEFDFETSPLHRVLTAAAARHVAGAASSVSAWDAHPSAAVEADLAQATRSARRVASVPKRPATVCGNRSTVASVATDQARTRPRQRRAAWR
jgi:hypothetical protein